MKTRRNPQRLAQILVFFVVAISVVTPVARASTSDAVARYLTAHSTSPDAIDRWLVGRDARSSFMQSPVSDVASSLEVARVVDQRDQPPVSDVASSLGLTREQFDRTIADAAGPISDTADSLAVARRAAAASIGSDRSPAGFAWHDAGIGAGAALLLVATAACSLLVLRRHRHLAA